jgi:hypothetical protein
MKTFEIPAMKEVAISSFKTLGFLPKTIKNSHETPITVKIKVAKRKEGDANE